MSEQQIATMIQNAVKAAVQGQPATTPKTAAAVKTAPTPMGPVPTTLTANDLKLLAIIESFKGKPRADGKPSGSLAVKVHGYLHSCGVPEPAVRALIDDAAKRLVISKMAVPIGKGPRAGGKFMLYFDYKARPVAARVQVADSEALAVRTAFGL